MARTSPTQAEVASSYTLWCEHFDTLGLDSREDFDAMLNSEKMEMLAFAFGEDVDIESAPPMMPERAAEVEIMYARAEGAAAIVTAAVQWRKYPTNWQAELTKAIDHYLSLPR